MFIITARYFSSERLQKDHDLAVLPSSPKRTNQWYDRYAYKRYAYKSMTVLNVVPNYIEYNFVAERIDRLF